MSVTKTPAPGGMSLVLPWRLFWRRSCLLVPDGLRGEGQQPLSLWQL